MNILSAKWGDTRHTRIDLTTESGIVSITKHPPNIFWDQIVASGMPIAPSVTVKSARYANADRTAIHAITIERAGIIASQTDTPELWREIIDSGVTIFEYNAPEKFSARRDTTKRKSSRVVRVPCQTQ